MGCLLLFDVRLCGTVLCSTATKRSKDLGVAQSGRPIRRLSNSAVDVLVMHVSVVKALYPTRPRPITYVMLQALYRGGPATVQKDLWSSLALHAEMAHGYCVQCCTTAVQYITVQYSTVHMEHIIPVGSECVCHFHLMHIADLDFGR